MAAPKKTNKAADTAPVKKTVAPPQKKHKKTERPTAVVSPRTTPVALTQPKAQRAAGPTSRTCPLVLDGEMDAADFSPGSCLTCDEFDCRFCEAEAGSGALRSRLFAGGEEGGEEDDGWGGGDPDFDRSDDEEPVEGEDEDPF